MIIDLPRPIDPELAADLEKESAFVSPFLRRLPPLAGWLLTMAVVIAGLVFFRAADLGTALVLLGALLGMTPAGPLPDLGLATGTALAWIGLLGTIALACPNTQELMARHWFSSDPAPELAPAPRRLSWRPSAAWAVPGAILLAAALGSLSGESSFLYYQF